MKKIKFLVKLALQGGPQISQFCPKLLFIKFSVGGCDFAIIVKAYFKQKLLFPIFETHEPYGKFQAHIFFNLALKYHWSAHGPKIFLKILGLALNNTVINQIYCLKIGFDHLKCYLYHYINTGQVVLNLWDFVTAAGTRFVFCIYYWLVWKYLKNYKTVLTMSLIHLLILRFKATI